jgi:hypothetical protein
MGLGFLAEQQGNTPMAIQNYAQAVQLQPGLEQAQRALSRLLGGM